MCDLISSQYMTNPVMGGSVQETPLAHACARGFQDIAELLIQNKANVNFLCSVRCVMEHLTHL